MAEQAPQAAELTFHFEKGNFFRTIHVDGAWGGVCPNGKYLHVSLFSERQTIPKKAVYAVDLTKPEADLKVPTRTEDRGGLFREVEVCAIMDLEVAVSLRSWLDERIAQLMKLQEMRHEHRK